MDIDDTNNNSNVEKIDKLLDEFEEQRDHLKKMIKEVEDIKQKLDKLLPEPNNSDNDFRNYMKGSRYMSLFEERVKSITEFFRIVLEMRREISKTIKDEVELRRKSEQGLSEDNLDIDISKLAEQVEKKNRERQEYSEKVRKLKEKG